jgi:hypothetical protein
MSTLSIANIEKAPRRKSSSRTLQYRPKFTSIVLCQTHPPRDLGVPVAAYFLFFFGKIVRGFESLLECLRELEYVGFISYFHNILAHQII